MAVSRKNECDQAKYSMRLYRTYPDRLRRIGEDDPHIVNLINIISVEQLAANCKEWMNYILKWSPDNQDWLKWNDDLRQTYEDALADGYHFAAC